MSMIDNKKHICLFIPTLDVGGAEAVIISIANWLVSKDMIVDLVLLRKQGAMLDRVSPDVNLVSLNSNRLLTSIPKLVNYLRSRKPSVILSSTTLVNIVTIFASLISFSKIRVVVTEVSNICTSVKEHSKINPTVSEFIIKFLMKILYKKASVIIAVSKGSAKSLSEYLKIDINDICVIYNPVYSKNMIKLSRSPVHHPWFSNKNIPIILAVGRLSKAKGFDTLIDAFYRVRENRSARLIILGEGDCRRELEIKISYLNLDNDVSLPGYADNPLAYMRNSNLFVLSSRREGFANVLVEALACETPIISTNCLHGPSEILENGRWGRLVEVDNPQELAKSIIEELDKEHQSNLCRARKFSIDIACELYYSVCFPERPIE